MQDMMSSATSTTAQVNKHTRFDESNIEDTSPRKRQLPKALALDFIKTKLGHSNLQSLPPSSSLALTISSYI
eukprot:14953784-Ditylum_brightwellii.AAC.3